MQLVPHPDDAAVQRAKEAIRKYGRFIFDMLADACSAAKRAIDVNPHDHPRDAKDDNFAYSSIVRLHTLRALRKMELSPEEAKGKIILARPHSLSVAFLIGEEPFRLYKLPRSGRVRSASQAQVKFMTQEQYQKATSEENLFGEQLDVLPGLNIAVLWQAENFELTEVLFVVPNGWTTEGDLATVFEDLYDLSRIIANGVPFSGEIEEEILVGQPDVAEECEGTITSPDLSDDLVKEELGDPRGSVGAGKDHPTADDPSAMELAEGTKASQNVSSQDEKAQSDAGALPKDESRSRDEERN